MTSTLKSMVAIGIAGVLAAGEVTLEAAQHAPPLFSLAGGAVAVVLLFIGLRAQWRADMKRDEVALDRQLKEWHDAVDKRFLAMERQLDRVVYGRRYTDNPHKADEDISD